MRTIGLAMAVGFIALTVGAGLASAQVAAPRLNSLVSEAQTPINPAVLPWNGNSMLGGAYADAKVESEFPASPAQEAASGNGAMAQFRWVNGVFGVGAEAAKVSLDINQIPFGGGTLESKTNWFGAAGQLGGVLSVGVGQQAIEDSVSGNANGDNTDTSTLPMAGVSVRLFEMLYIGAAGGTETFEREDSNGTPPTAEADRSVVRYGLAYAMRDGESGVHVEYYVQNRDAINDVVIGFSRPSEESDGATVEVVFANWLLGFEKFDTDRIVESTDVVIQTVDRSKISVGWVPEQGVNIVASGFSSEDTNLDPASTGYQQTITVDGITLAVGWAF